MIYANCKLMKQLEIKYLILIRLHKRLIYAILWIFIVNLRCVYCQLKEVIMYASTLPELAG
jgi:hypothetical protein